MKGSFVFWLVDDDEHVLFVFVSPHHASFSPGVGHMVGKNSRKERGQTRYMFSIFPDRLVPGITRQNLSICAATWRVPFIYRQQSA